MTMSNDISLALPSTKDQQWSDSEVEWCEVVEKRRCGSEPVSVRISEIDQVADLGINNVREGDELILSDITVKSVQLSLANDTNDAADRESVVFPINFGGKYEACPIFSSSHIFTSVRELIDVYPFIYDIIIPKEPFTIENVEVSAWEILQVVTMVQGTPFDQLLVNAVRQKRKVLLPSTLQVEFLQWNDNWSLSNEPGLKNEKPREYSLAELSEFWSLKFHPTMIRIHQQCNFSELTYKPSRQSPSRETFSRKFSSIFKSKPEKKIISPTINEEIDEDYWMIPESWRSQKLVLEPIQVVHVTNVNTSETFDLPGELKMKVIDLSSNNSPRSCSITLSDDVINDDVSSRSSRSLSDSPVSLQQLDISSLLSNKSRDDAIVTVVTNGSHSGGRHPNNLSLGSLLAIHRTRRLRKLLVMNTNAQYFLVSAHYGGVFKRLPLVFGCAGDVPTGDDAVYVTRCTAYPVDKLFDACHEGQFVRFQKTSIVVINNVDTEVVNCTVSNSLDAEQRAVKYPLNLSGNFEKIDVSATDMTIYELFKKSLPICAQVAHPDSSLGFDPLAHRQELTIKKVISETTVIVETLRKCEEGIHSAGAILELPTARSSLLVRELPNDFYPRRKEFQGLLKLPCVEMLAERDVNELQNSSRNLSTTSILSPTESEEKLVVSTTQPKLPQYTLVMKNKDRICAERKSEDKEDNVFSAARKTSVLNNENIEQKTNLNDQKSSCDKTLKSEPAGCNCPAITSFDNPIYRTGHFVKPVPLPRKKYQSSPGYESDEISLSNLSAGELKSKSASDIAAESASSEKSNKSYAVARSFSSAEYYFVQIRNGGENRSKHERKSRSLENLYKASTGSFESINERREEEENDVYVTVVNCPERIERVSNVKRPPIPVKPSFLIKR